jgi:hypothetical protein
MARYVYFVSMFMPLLKFEQMDCMIRNWIEEMNSALVLKKKILFETSITSSGKNFYYTQFPPKCFDQYGEASRNEVAYF